MEKRTLAEALHLELEPVAITLTDDEPTAEDFLKFEGKGESTASSIPFIKGQKDCPAAYIIAAAKAGISSYFDRANYDACDGGRLGLGFTREYRDAHRLSCYLSTGDEALKEWNLNCPFSSGRGERLFATPEIAYYSKHENIERELIPTRYVVFQPLSKVAEDQTPDQIHIFANPDQLSALIIMLGFMTGERDNVNARFEAACHCVSLTYQESLTDKPRAVLGFVDLGQRPDLPKDLLSLTMSYDKFKEIEACVEESCITSEGWKPMAERLPQ